jgi:crossover junction endodeoxyribonuclease RuvC
MPVRVLGVDPGSAATGWALIVAEGNRYRLEATGVVRPKGGDRVERLADLERRFVEVVERLRPDCAAVESSFSGRNPRSGLQLAESRGVILAALGRQAIATSSYSPAEIKSAIVGHGRAEKHQVAYMVTRLLGLAAEPARDAADAIAVGLTHLHSQRPRMLVDGRWRSC